MAVQKHFLAVVLLSLHVVSNVVQYAQADVIVLLRDELSALQELYMGWNQSTEDVKTSLPGWTWFDPATSYDDPAYVDPCYFDSWRGVFCYIAYNAKASTNDSNFYDARVVSLTVSDASIVGTLPDTNLDRKA